MEESRLKISQDWCNLITQITLNYQQQLNNRVDEDPQKTRGGAAELSHLKHSTAEKRALAKI